MTEHLTSGGGSKAPVTDLVYALAGSLEAHLEDCINLDLNDPEESAHYWAMCEEVALDILVHSGFFATRPDHGWG